MGNPEDGTPCDRERFLKHAPHFKKYIKCPKILKYGVRMYKIKSLSS